MNTIVKIPQITLAVSSRHVYFRLDNVSSQVLFFRYLRFFRERFPHMQWHKQIGMWELPICDLKSLYELCRVLFGVNSVQFQSGQYMGESQHVQLDLFDPVEET